jgi:hypothetical protein
VGADINVATGVLLEPPSEKADEALGELPERSELVVIFLIDARR